MQNSFQWNRSMKMKWHNLVCCILKIKCLLFFSSIYCLSNWKWFCLQYTKKSSQKSTHAIIWLCVFMFIQRRFLHISTNVTIKLNIYTLSVCNVCNCWFRMKWTNSLACLWSVPKEKMIYLWKLVFIFIIVNNWNNSLLIVAICYFHIYSGFFFYMPLASLSKSHSLTQYFSSISFGAVKFYQN